MENIVSKNSGRPRNFVRIGGTFENIDNIESFFGTTNSLLLTLKYPKEDGSLNVLRLTGDEARRAWRVLTDESCPIVLDEDGIERVGDIAEQHELGWLPHEEFSHIGQEFVVAPEKCRGGLRVKVLNHVGTQIHASVHLLKYGGDLHGIEIHLMGATKNGPAHV